MDAKIIFYKQDGLDQNTKFKLRRELLGVQQKSNFSKYTYEVKGILNKVLHYRPVKSTIIIEKKNLKPIKDILKKYNTKLEIFDIIIPKSKLT